jgi:5-formyltetrahydrofolate cyclo-ligase
MPFFPLVATSPFISFLPALAPEAPRTNSVMPKHTLRQYMLGRRRHLSRKDIESASALIQGRFLSLPLYTAAHVVALYAPVDNEVLTAEVMVKAIGAGKRIVLPMVQGASLQYREVSDPACLLPGHFGILRPPESCPTVSLHEIDAVVVPGVAFDMGGHRIGYGKGYFDRCFHDWEGTGRLVGFCYDFQLLEEILGEPHDVEMDIILTERRMITARNLP